MSSPKVVDRFLETATLSRMTCIDKETLYHRLIETRHKFLHIISGHTNITKLLNNKDQKHF